jgi:hypothetical protein
MSQVMGYVLHAVSEQLNLVARDRGTRVVHLTQDSDLVEYSQLFYDVEGIALPLDYLKRGKVFVFRDKRDSIVGGFAIVTRGPFRSIEQIPHTVRLPNTLRLAEVNGLWFKGSPCQFARLRFWARVVGQIFREPVEGVVYAVCAGKTRLRERIFDRIREWTLYEGVVSNLPGMDSTSSSIEAVEIAFKSKLRTCFNREVAGYVKRSFRKELLEDETGKFRKPA